MKEYKVKVFEDRVEWRNKDGKLHREDGPAIERSNGSKEYWIDGQLHREDGPAVEWSNGGKEYYINGKLHRENGPAVEWNGDKEYYINGKRHREDGPAVEWANGSKEYWINDKELTKKQFDNRNKVKELNIGEIEKLLGYKVKIVK